MSLPVVMHVHQRLCLLLESNCLIDDQIQKTRHLIDDFKRSFFVVIDKAFVNAVITKVTAGVSGFSKLLRKTKSINSGSQIATFGSSSKALFNFAPRELLSITQAKFLCNRLFRVLLKSFPLMFRYSQNRSSARRNKPAAAEGERLAMLWASLYGSSIVIGMYSDGLTVAGSGHTSFLLTKKVKPLQHMHFLIISLL